MTIAAGKRIAPRLPKAVGPWLCGHYDNDRSVARSAADALAGAFATPEKRQALWKIYKGSLLDFAEDAILKQTVQTLSDERSTSKDDAESKYARVAGSAMTMLGYLIRAHEGNQDFHHKVSPMIINKGLWDFVNHKDPYLRRSICTLAILCTTEFRDELDWSVMSSRFLSKGLYADQLGSAGQFSAALLALTTTRPELWTSDYSGKTSAAKRLIQYLRKGSQRGPEIVWTNLPRLVRAIPRSALATDNSDFTPESAAALAEALHTGVTSQDEPRPNLTAAWSCYVELTFWLQSLLPEGARSTFVGEHISPLVVRYVEGSKEGPGLPAASGPRLAADVLSRLRESDLQEILASLWSQLGAGLIERMKLSLPESSKDFKVSQDAIVAHANRLFKLKEATASQATTPVSAVTCDAFKSTDERLLESAIDLLINRNGKPYGCAAVLLDIALQGKFEKNNADVQRFLDEHTKQLLQSPSAEYLVSLWRACGRPTSALLQPLAMSPASNEYGDRALLTLLGKAIPEDVDAAPEVASLLLTTTKVPVIAAFLGNSNLRGSQVIGQYVQRLLGTLSPETDATAQLESLKLLEQLVAHSDVKATLISNDRAGELLARLLFLTDSSSIEISDTASALLSKLKASQDKDSVGPSTTLNVIMDQLSGTEPQISILSLAELGSGEYQNAANKSEIVASLLPSAEQWSAALKPHLLQKRPSLLAISSPLQGVVYTLQDNGHSTTRILRDAEDFSMAFRLCLYVTKLAATSSFLESLNEASPEALYNYFPVALQLINEKLTLDTANEIWINSTPEVIDEASDVLSQANSIIQTWMSASDSPFTSSWLVRVSELQGLSVETYLTGLAFADIATRSAERDGGHSLAAQYESEIRNLHRSPDLIQAASIASSAREYLMSSTAGRKVLNELVSDVTGQQVDQLTIHTIKPLVLLNILLNGSSDALEGVQSQRLVFLMQNLVRLLSSGTLDLVIESEIVKLLAALLPAIQDIYGEHWSEIIDTLVDTWTELNDPEGDLPTLNATLRLYQKLASLSTGEDANEDLLEAWNASKPKMDKALLECLQLFAKPSEGVNQPRQICASLLGRLLLNVRVEDIGSIFPLMESSSDAVLETAFSILHREIPAGQEQLSIELVLENQTARLPAELLHLIADHHRSPQEWRRYLLCWKLVFDHFENASYKLKETYTNELKAASRVPDLLDLVCDMVRITSNRPVDASKFGFEQFELGTSESDAQEMLGLSTHLYYCCLLQTPSLVKAWYIEQKNRIKSPLEAWTQKYFSPTIVAASFDTVAEWAETQDKDDSPVDVKANARSFDLVASMAIDPESPPISMSVVLPSAYPLDSPTVASRTRVAVSEKNWQSWLRTIQIIIFSTGSIIEGLVAFRRNVQGALKGQGECAICYSIIGTDMQTPNKKCGTCKNMFHGSCLFRWFKSSNSSTCPLCRNSFSYA